MKKKFLVYSIYWLILLVLFNIIIFLTPNEIFGTSKFSVGFWVGYGFAIGAFIGQLLCAWFVFKERDNRRFFYNLSLITISYTALVLMVVISAVLMIIPQIPAWITAIICSVVLAFNVIAVIKAKAAATIVENIDDKIKTNTAFIRELTMKANDLIQRAQTAELKKEAKNVYETLRYSDPVSSEQLTSIENEIATKFEEFAKCISTNDETHTKSTVNALIALISERANKCKFLKKN